MRRRWHFRDTRSSSIMALQNDRCEKEIEKKKEKKKFNTFLRYTVIVDHLFLLSKRKGKVFALGGGQSGFGTMKPLAFSQET